MNRLGAATTLLISVALACTPLDPVGDTFLDVVTLGPEWECLRTPLSMTPAEAPPERITYVVPIVDFDSQPRSPSPVPGIRITICDSSRCEPPVPQCDTVETADCVAIRQAAGQPPFVYALSFPYGFENGVLRLEAPGYAGMDYVLGGPMVGTREGAPVVQGLAIAMPLQTTAEQVSLDVGAAPDPSRGTLTVRTLDCEGQRAPGVELQSIDAEQGIAFVLSDNNRPTRNLRITDARGVAGLVALPSLTIDVIGVAPSGLEFGGPTTVGVRAGVITVAELRQGLGLWGQ